MNILKIVKMYILNKKVYCIVSSLNACFVKLDCAIKHWKLTMELNSVNKMNNNKMSDSSHKPFRI